MKTHIRNLFTCGLSIAVVLQLGVLAGSAQTNIYLFSGSKTNITLKPGTYIITAYGAPGAYPSDVSGGSGAEMSAEFNFSTPTTLTLLVGGGGSPGYFGGGGGGGGSFVVQGSTPLLIAGGGGGGGEEGGGHQGENGNVSTKGGHSLEGAPGCTGGGGGGGGAGGSGGGGFLGNGTNGVAFYYGFGGGFSFENGGYGGVGSDGGGAGGFGVGGGGTTIGLGGGGTSGAGGGGGYSGGGGGSVYVAGGGGGGGSIIGSSAIAILTEVSGVLSPDDLANGEIIIIAVPTPLVITTHAAFGFTNGVFGFNVTGPAGSNVVIQASTDLQTWFPLQTNLLGSGPLYFSDPQSPANTRRFYRLQLSP